MSYDHEISVHINTPTRPSYGYPIEFEAVDEWDNPIPLTFISGVSGFCFEVISGLTYRMWRDCVSGHFSITNSGMGWFSWVVQPTFFDQLGVYEGKMRIRMSGMKFIVLDDLKISVTGQP